MNRLPRSIQPKKSLVSVISSIKDLKDVSDISMTAFNFSVQLFRDLVKEGDLKCENEL